MFRLERKKGRSNRKRLKGKVVAKNGEKMQLIKERHAFDFLIFICICKKNINHYIYFRLYSVIVFQPRQIVTLVQKYAITKN